MTESPPVVDVAETRTQARRLFLASGDVQCPRCRYNLRGVTVDSCPECGWRLVLILRNDDAVLRVRWLLMLMFVVLIGVSVVGAWSKWSTIGSLQSAMRAIVSSYDRGLQTLKDQSQQLEDERRVLASNFKISGSEQVRLQLDLTNQNLAEIQLAMKQIEAQRAAAISSIGFTWRWWKSHTIDRDHGLMLIGASISIIALLVLIAWRSAAAHLLVPLCCLVVIVAVIDLVGLHLLLR